jgi:hypothetical protein
MELLLQRTKLLDHATIGELTDDAGHVCWILEDRVRERPGVPVAEWKVAGETAVPSGRYKVIINESARFGRPLPLLVGVPGFSGVRIHPGNDHDDTEGCLLPGAKFTGDGVVLESRKAFAQLFELIDGAIEGGEEVWITIQNPVAVEA